MSRLGTMIVAIALLAACTPFAEKQSARDVGATALPDVAEVWQMAGAATGDVRFDWIARLEDPVLGALVEDAQENNRDLRQAAARVAQFRARVRQSRSGLWPALNYSGSVGEAGPLEGSGSRSYDAGVQLNWELDLWGRLRANRWSAYLTAEAAAADYRFSQYALAASVAQGYFLLIEAGLQEEVAKKSLAVLAETSRIVSAQRELGAVSSLDVALARRDLANAEASLANAEVNRRQALRALEVLLGRYPASALAARVELPAVPAPPPPGLPAGLLVRRPDIIASELSLAASFKNLEAARASRLPTLSLTGALSGASSELSEVLDSDNAGWQLATSLLGPLFDAGLRRSQIEEGAAARSEALEAYVQTVLTAFQEVENGLDQIAILERRERALRDAAEAANRALSLARLRYREGETDLLDVLTIQSTTFTADSALVTVQRERLDQWVNLNLALGGSWTAP